MYPYGLFDKEKLLKIPNEKVTDPDLAMKYFLESLSDFLLFRMYQNSLRKKEPTLTKILFEEGVKRGIIEKPE